MLESVEILLIGKGILGWMELYGRATGALFRCVPIDQAVDPAVLSAWRST